MKNKKLFLILTTAFLLIATACSGGFIDPGMIDQPGGGYGGGSGGGYGGGGGSGGGGHGGGGGVGSGPDKSIPLTAGKWTNGNIAESEIWYSINVTAGKTYYFWWNNTQDLFGGLITDEESGDGTKTGKIMVMGVSYSINVDAFVEADNAWLTPVSFTVTSSGTVYIVAIPVLPGTFAIAYNTTNTRPN